MYGATMTRGDNDNEKYGNNLIFSSKSREFRAQQHITNISFVYFIFIFTVFLIVIVHHN